jgi:AcrR family transcriptional regulator
VAQRAGLSPRSLFRYFDDVDDLCRAAVDRHIRRILPLNEILARPEDPAPTKAAALAAQRVRLFEGIGSVGVVSRLQAPFQPLVQDELTRARQGWRHQVAELFGPEIDALGAAGAVVLAAADALCSFESYQLLRHDQGCSPARVRAVLATALTALFGRPDGQG